MITPNDIETKVFSSSVRGYNKREVDEFLDQIMIDYQALLDQNAKMLERVHVLQKQVSEAKDPSHMSKDAQRLMSDISASAEQKAEVIIQNAKNDAANIVKNAKNSTAQTDEDAERLRQKVEKFKLRFKQMLEDEMERVDDTSEDLLDDLRKDFYPSFLYGEGAGQDYTKVAPSVETEELINELPDVEPEDEEDREAVEEAAADITEEAPEEQFAHEAEYEPESETEFEAETEEPDEGEPAPEEEPEGPASEEGSTEEPADEYAEYAAGPEESIKADEIVKSAEEIDDPLLARAKEENVDLDDLPGFRSSASSMDDTVVLKKLKKDETMELTPEKPEKDD